MLRRSRRNPVSYTHLDVYKRQGLYMESREELDIGITDENGELLDNTGIINELGVYDPENSFYLSLSVENVFYEGMTVNEYLQFIVSTYSSRWFCCGR